MHAAGSFLNHACRCHHGHVYDVYGMYLAVYALTALFLCRALITTTLKYSSLIWTVSLQVFEGLPPLSRFLSISPQLPSTPCSALPWPLAPNHYTPSHMPSRLLIMLRHSWGWAL